MLVRSMGGGDFTADSLFYRPLSSNVLSALQTNMANAFQYVTDACSQFKDFTLAMYNKYNSDEIRTVNTKDTGTDTFDRTSSGTNTLKDSSSNTRTGSESLITLYSPFKRSFNIPAIGPAPPVTNKP